MTTPIEVQKLQSKSHDQADEVRTPDKTRLEITRYDGFTFGRMTLQPGWRWTECIKPVVGGESCQLSHAGYMISGSLTVQLEDGSTATVVSGTSYTIPPGHDAWVEGNEPVVCVEVMSAEQFGKTAS
jgi:mannose-6-phosphate isomerase-like protein (cupin superfamily)